MERLSEEGVEKLELQATDLLLKHAKNISP